PRAHAEEEDQERREPDAARERAAEDVEPCVGGAEEQGLEEEDGLERLAIDREEGEREERGPPAGRGAPLDLLPEEPDPVLHLDVGEKPVARAEEQRRGDERDDSFGGLALRNADVEERLREEPR